MNLYALRLSYHPQYRTFLIARLLSAWATMIGRLLAPRWKIALSEAEQNLPE